MSKAPERITAWLSKDGSTRFEGGKLFPAGVEVEYVRADHIEELEAKLAKAVEGFGKLACLGNGNCYGHSYGNVIAQRYLAELKGQTEGTKE